MKEHLRGGFIPLLRPYLSPSKSTVNSKEFVIAALDIDSKIFVVHVAIWE